MSQLPLITKADPAFASFFRYREVNGRVLVTNQVGQYLMLEPSEFKAFVEGKVDPTDDLYARLKANNFVRAEVDIDDMSGRLRLRKQFLNTGPNLHVCVVTLRCNETCVYCHASRAGMEETQTDMSPETGRKMVDIALQTTSPWVTIEFQGGEPLVNFPVVKEIIEYAKERNKEVGKTIEFTMVSNLGMMDEEKLAFLLEHKVQICTSIDGPEALHNKQRVLVGGNAYEKATFWIKRINEAYGEMGLDTNLYHVEALLTTTREALGLHKEIVDTYVGLGCKALFLRPLDPFGFAAKTAEKVGYERHRFLEFYANSVEYMLELNKQGVEILERYAGILLTKIIAGEDPNFLDLRNPAGTGIGCIAYNYDGRIFTSDEGRMLHEMGDSLFQIGHVDESSYQDLVRHETVQAMTLASQLDANPDCVNCAYNPYCGISPEFNYRHQGSFQGRMRESPWCQTLKGIQDYLFKTLDSADAETLDLFNKWTTIRPREHFLQGSDS